MASIEALFSALFAPTYRLPNSIVAIPASCASTSGPELGAISHLPDGAELTLCGEGFNETTLKVRWEGQSYFIFAQDLVAADSALQPDTSDPNGIPRKRSKTQPLQQLTASQVA
jgi:hypothetical protein